MSEESTPLSGAERDDTIARLVQLAGHQPQLDPARRQRLEAAVRPLWLRTVRRRRARTAALRLSAVAAALLAVAAAGLGFFRLDPLGLRPVASLTRVAGALDVDGERLDVAGSGVRAGQQLGTGEARVALSLRDGVAVRLDRQSRLRMVAEDELALERGAVYVDTEGGEGGIRVATPFGVVEDIGTRFEVRVDEERLRVRVRDGLVIVRRAEASWDGRPGEELTLLGDDEPSRGAVPIWGDPWDWTLEVSAARDFDGLPLSDLLTWAAHESGTELRFAESELVATTERCTVRGDVAGLPLHEALDAALPVCGLTHRMEGGELRLATLAGEEAP